MENAWILDLQNSRAIRLNQDGFRIGRKHKDLDYCVDADTVSRLHCEIRCMVGKWFIEDKHSANGTFCNGEQIPSDILMELTSGDIITIGEYRLMFLLREGEV